MKVAVKDANILIDLAQCGGLDAWFSLGIETYTTTLVLNEITDVNQRSQIQSYVRAQSLRVVDYDGAKLAQAFALKRGGLGSLTIQDATVMHLALELGAMLLTGDSVLRSFARLKLIEVHGTLWVLDELVRKATIPPSVAAEKLHQLMAAGSRLPQRECEERLRNWTKGKR